MRTQLILVCASLLLMYFVAMSTAKTCVDEGGDLYYCRSKELPLCCERGYGCCTLAPQEPKKLLDTETQTEREPSDSDEIKKTSSPSLQYAALLFFVGGAFFVIISCYKCFCETEQLTPNQGSTDAVRRRPGHSSRVRTDPRTVNILMDDLPPAYEDCVKKKDPPTE